MNVEITKYLIDKGVDLEYENNSGKKPIDLINDKIKKEEILKYLKNKN